MTMSTRAAVEEQSGCPVCTAFRPRPSNVIWSPGMPPKWRKLWQPTDAPELSTSFSTSPMMNPWISSNGWSQLCQLSASTPEHNEDTMDRHVHIVGTGIIPMNRRDRTIEDMAHHVVADALADADVRSEEHTSELQSLS